MDGLLVNCFGRYYTVFHEGKRINCVLRGRIKKDKRLKIYSEPVATGDIVDFEINEDGSGVINDIHPRENVFSRKDRGRQKEDIIASNLDQIVIVQSFYNPRLNLRFVDRLLVRGKKEGIPVLLCVNKLDLAEKEDLDYVDSYYRNADIRIHMTSAETGEGVEEFKELTIGQLSVFTGSSGVGKTSLLNRLYPGLNLRTSEVSESSGKGRHTTTNVSMMILDDGTRIIDTPGVREFGLMDIEPHFLGTYFADFQKHSQMCNFRPCTHDHEPGCEVKRQVEEGNISEDRYVSYLNILYSLKEYYDNMY